MATLVPLLNNDQHANREVGMLALSVTGCDVLRVDCGELRPERSALIQDRLMDLRTERGIKARG